jgi:GNAT superfamily N-acetyltransferase
MNPSALHLQLANSSDIGVISAMAERIWTAHYTPIIGKEQVEYMLEKMYSAKSLSEQMNAGQLFFIAQVDDKPVGYISISKKGESDFFMHKFYMETDQQGKGLGKKIFSALIARFPELKTMRLQVNRMNFKTINFYFRVGFIIEEAKMFDIGDGFFMDDYVMVLRK